MSELGDMSKEDEAYVRQLEAQRDDMLTILKEIQDGAVFSEEFCQRLDAVIEECGK